jgi:hypothetical protein
MLQHYVEAHAYAPPEEFVQALLASPLPGTSEYEMAVAPFCKVEEIPFEPVWNPPSPELLARSRAAPERRHRPIRAIEGLADIALVLLGAALIAAAALR